MIVLDSSAVLAVLFDEPGADRVKTVLSQGIISAASLAEILTKVVRRGLDLDGAYVRIIGFGFEVYPVEEEHALLAANIYARAPAELDLSLGDRLCIALAMALKCELLTADRGMAAYDAGIPITRFR